MDVVEVWMGINCDHRVGEEGFVLCVERDTHYPVYSTFYH